MDKNKILRTLNIIVKEQIKNDDLSLDFNVFIRDVEGWDSLTNIQIISEIENTFNVKFSLSEILEMKKVEDICNLISLKLTN